MKLLPVGIPALIFGPNQHRLITLQLVFVCSVDVETHSLESTNGFACRVEHIPGECAERRAVLELSVAGL